MYGIESGLYEKQKRKIQSDYSSIDTSIFDLLTRPKYEFPDPELGDKTWAEWRDEEQMKQEAERSIPLKTAILTDFDVLRGKVKKLLDTNETGPEIEKLPVSSFDLDTAGRDHKLKTGRNVCENLRLEMEHHIFEVQRVYIWIKESFWDPQELVGKCLFSIFGKMEVTNYPTVQEKPFTQDYLRWTKFCKETEDNILENGRFEAWKVYTSDMLEAEVNKQMTLYREEVRRIDLLLEDEDEYVTTEDDIEQLRAIEGKKMIEMGTIKNYTNY